MAQKKIPVCTPNGANIAAGDTSPKRLRVPRAKVVAQPESSRAKSSRVLKRGLAEPITILSPASGAEDSVRGVSHTEARSSETEARASPRSVQTALGKRNSQKLEAAARIS